MTYQTMKDLYDTLRNNSSITTIVPSGNISVGWNTELIDFPNLSIKQNGGDAVGRLGYSGLSGNIDETFNVQIDVYSDSSTLETYNIINELDNVMISSGYRKTSDNDMYDDELDIYRKVTRWSKRLIYNK